MKNILKSALIICVLVTFFSCSKSVEGENKKHEEFTQNISKAKARLPHYGQLIDAELAKQNKAWADLKSEKDEEKKIEKMAAVNKSIDDSFLGELASIEKRYAEIERLQSKMRNKRMTRSQSDKYNKGMEKLNEATDLLKQTPNSADDAMTKAKKADDLLFSAIMSVKGSSKKKRRRKKKY